jgi:hypothetical protein
MRMERCMKETARRVGRIEGGWKEGISRNGSRMEEG